MPLVSRIAIRAGILYLLLGLLAWVVYSANQTDIIDGNWSALRPVSIHFLTVGWLTQIIFAVMYWMFPIISREQPYGTTWISWLGLIGINLGLIARAVFEIGLSRGMPTDAGWGLVGAALLQWGGATAWIINTWGRIKPRGGK